MALRELASDDSSSHIIVWSDSACKSKLSAPRISGGKDTLWGFKLTFAVAQNKQVHTSLILDRESLFNTGIMSA